MPREYTAIRDDLKRRGKSDAEAKRIAAATYNKRHSDSPLRSGKHDDEGRSKRKVK